ncbi:ATP-binding protein [Nonomuraea turcica]|uniref:ATP-binding protein n=1 Tax=Nonomuraea sp. G32 TaxID=3067274 RepID=UPI00273C68BF|nr:AAA family ATPase [Nonomuraea sp. G32]MDP4506946.1 LuxR family transcriptional regulator [Nonomuraea sp. G32]
MMEDGFFGRRREIAKTRRALSQARLVTLTGAGGVGKTRLAMETAARISQAFPDGVWPVELAPVPDGTLVAKTAATALGGIQAWSARRPQDHLADFLADRRLLIVLDNCEHLLEGCATFVDMLLRRAPALHVLATSRQTLGVEGEHVLAVPPLPVPDPARLPSTAALARCESVRLLLARTMRPTTPRAPGGEPGFVLTTANRRAVATLCTRLEGIPLAIELAAARLGELPLEQVAGQLDDRFTLPTAGGRPAPHRQRTLRNTIDWSHELCTPPQRLLWARLSVFAGGFDLDAAESVCAGAGLDGADILDLVDDLVTRSIIQRVETDGAVRYRMLETIREFGRERLAVSGETRRVACRHRDHYLGLAERAAARWCGPAQRDVLALLRAEHDNLQAALEWSLADPAEAGAALALAAALRYHWCVNGYRHEGRRWLDRALAASPESSPARPTALWAAAWVSLQQGDHEAVAARLEECALLAAERGDEVARAYVLTWRGANAIFQARAAEAIGLLDQAIAVHRRAGDPSGVLTSICLLVTACTDAGDLDRGRAIAERGLSASEELDEHYWRSYILCALGWNTWMRGDDATAEDHLRRALAIELELHDAVGTVSAIEPLSWIAESRGEYFHAARLSAAAGVVRQLTGIPPLLSPNAAVQHARCEQGILQALGKAEARTSRIHARRSCRTIEHAVDYALAVPSVAARSSDSTSRPPESLRTPAQPETATPAR